MSSYKVKLGEEIVTVDGLAGLVKLVQEGRLSPEDPVFIPSTNRWHYARSVRQLREYFPGTPEPPREEPRRAAPPKPEPPLPEEKRGADVVPLRQRGRWSAEGRVEVPVFSYSVDADPPPAFRWMRLALVTGFAIFAGFLVWVYITAYSEHLQGIESTLGKPTPVVALPTPATRTAKRNDARGATAGNAATPAPTTTLAPSTPPPTPAGTQAPLFDEGAALEKVLSAAVTPVTKPAELGNAIKKDLTRIAVPVRSVVFVPKTGAKGAKSAAVPFVCLVEYAKGEKIDEATMQKHRFQIVAMIGRRATELNLRLESVRVTAIAGKTRSERIYSADLARRVAEGGATAFELR